MSEHDNSFDFEHYKGLRTQNMMMARTIDELKGRMGSMHDQIMELHDELELAYEALRREMTKQLGEK